METKPVTREVVEQFTAFAQLVVNAGERNIYTLDSTYEAYRSTLTCEEGSKYVRVDKTSGPSRSVYCFIEKASGKVLKAASWKAPAKHARGSVYAADLTLSAESASRLGSAALLESAAKLGITQYGGAYLR